MPILHILGLCDDICIQHLDYLSETGEKAIGGIEILCTEKALLGQRLGLRERNALLNIAETGTLKKISNYLVEIE